jgi:hypothetical protein
MAGLDLLAKNGDRPRAGDRQAGDRHSLAREDGFEVA